MMHVELLCFQTIELPRSKIFIQVSKANTSFIHSHQVVIFHVVLKSSTNIGYKICQPE